MDAKKGGKQAQKVPKKAENGGGKGQPTKRKVGFKIMRNRTAKQREEWLQIKRPKEGSQQVKDGCKKLKERGSKRGAKRGKKEEQAKPEKQEW